MYLPDGLLRNVEGIAPTFTMISCSCGRWPGAFSERVTISNTMAGLTLVGFLESMLCSVADQTPDRVASGCIGLIGSRIPALALEMRLFEDAHVHFHGRESATGHVNPGRHYIRTSSMTHVTGLLKDSCLLLGCDKARRQVQDTKQGYTVHQRPVETQD